MVSILEHGVPILCEIAFSLLCLKWFFHIIYIYIYIYIQSIIILFLLAIVSLSSLLRQQTPTSFISFRRSGKIKRKINNLRRKFNIRWLCFTINWFVFGTISFHLYIYRNRNTRHRCFEYIYIWKEKTKKQIKYFIVVLSQASSIYYIYYW